MEAVHQMMHYAQSLTSYVRLDSCTEVLQSTAQDRATIRLFGMGTACSYGNSSRVAHHPKV